MQEETLAITCSKFGTTGTFSLQKNSEDIQAPEPSIGKYNPVFEISLPRSYDTMTAQEIFTSFSKKKKREGIQSFIQTGSPFRVCDVLSGEVNKIPAAEESALLPEESHC